MPVFLKIQFAILLGIIFVIELAIGIAACVFRSDLEIVLKESLEKTIARSSMDDIMAWDNVQRKLQCCGVNGPSDWIDYSKNKTLRSSCCVPDVIDLTTQDCKNASPVFQHKYFQVNSLKSHFLSSDFKEIFFNYVYFQVGCLIKLRERVDSNATVLIGVGIGLAFIQVLGIALACWLAATIRKERAK